EEGERLLLATLQVEREGRAGAAAMALEDVGLARATLEEAEVADFLYLRMASKEVAHLGRILARAAHAHFERLGAAQEHPGGVRIADRPDRVAHHPDPVDQILVPDEPAGDEIAVPADIFGEAVDREVRAVAQRLGPERPKERVIDGDRRALVFRE